jgi:soluble lytic murein transglycosylase-like protein
LNAPKWLVFVLGLFGVTLLAKNAVAGQPEAAAAPSAAAPQPKWPYEAEVRSAAALHKVNPDLVAAVISWEQRSSRRWDPNATNPADPSYGLGQITPYIGVRFGFLSDVTEYRKLYEPQRNCNAVAAFLAYLLERYSLEDSIQVYNLGEPKFWNGKRVPDYLAGVLGYYEKYRKA